jgi:RHS repeat-associated protein
MKVGIEGGTNWVAEYYGATVVSAVNYYPFGSALAGRKYNDNTYRYGFNDKVKGNENSYDFGARLYDSRIGRWLSLNPLITKYPNLNPYNFVANSPLVAIDVDGKDYVVVIKPNKDGGVQYETSKTASDKTAVVVVRRCSSLKI